MAIVSPRPGYRHQEPVVQRGAHAVGGQPQRQVVFALVAQEVVPGGVEEIPGAWMTVDPHAASLSEPGHEIFGREWPARVHPGCEPGVGVVVPPTPQVV